ncbi:hypothetical protein DFJ73DRAFT_795572 [Zopfochytrium polystomum]|nr:hypothetical protein DFJ73DRAFT_795572 [Zopfochytrium polystomum]
MTRLRKTLGPRPDPRPDIPAAGATLDVSTLPTARDCLDHGDRIMFKKCVADHDGTPAHIAGRLPKKHSRRGRARAQYGPREEAAKGADGRSIPTGGKLPSFTRHPDFSFGMTAADDAAAKDIMYPGLVADAGGADCDDDDDDRGDDKERVRRQYIVSHGSYAPGERRQHYGPSFVPPPHRVLPDSHDNNGRRVREALVWAEERARERETKLVSKRLADWRERRQNEIGTVHDPLKSTIQHLPATHAFGVAFPPDDCTVGDLLQGRFRLQPARARRRRRPARPVRAEGETGDEDDEEEEEEDRLTGKITAMRVGEGGGRDGEQQVVYGVPTNYGDELDARALLSPTPRNTYGAAVLAQVAESLGWRDHGGGGERDNAQLRGGRGPAAVAANVA